MEAEIGPGARSDIAIDDVMIYSGQCPGEFKWLIAEEHYSESVTIVRRQRYEGGFHIRKNTLKK